ncbi:Catsper1, partial [Symbiodinium microadriaticum]
SLHHSMEKEAFARLLDRSWPSFRDRLLQSYPGNDADGIDIDMKLNERWATEDHQQEDQDDTGVEISRYASLGSLGTMEEASSQRAADLGTDSRTSADSRGSGSSASSEIMPAIPTAGSGAPYLRSRLKGLNIEEARAIRRRLRVRLGAITQTKLVSGKSLHDAVSALGLTRYGLQEINDIVNCLADFIGLRFSAPDHKGRPSQTSVTAAHIFSFHDDDAQNLGIPEWEWPPYRESYSTSSIHKSASLQWHALDKPRQQKYNAVPAQALMELCLAEETDIQYKIFGSYLKPFQAIREILLAGDTNRLVAELTFVRINDLAVPPEPLHPLLLLEPFVAVLIIANGVMIGFQTDPAYQDWDGWAYFEAAFASFLLLEIAFRVHLLKCRQFWCGTERYWNFFDIFLGVTGVTDVVMQFSTDQKVDFFATSLLRFCRLIRLVRIVKVFRLKFMRDLRLMVKGLIAGVKTLILAFTLLFSVIYVISGFATMVLGGHEAIDRLDLEMHFRTLPDSMFTCFRCFTGECVDEYGKPLTHMLAQEFGHIFVFSYVFSYMLVAMGIFNVILAVYVDITMKAAKENEAVTADQHARESIRIARTTRELLKKFAAAYHLFQDIEESDMSSIDISPNAALFTDDEIQDNIAVTKELFLLVIQDRQVQLLMDDLDLPPDRANLFEVIDADGSGTLHIAELVHGLLKIRGEVTKSDTVAALLATKAVQAMLSEIHKEVESTRENLRSEMGNHFHDFKKKLRKIALAAPQSTASNRRPEPTRKPRPLPIAHLQAPRRPDMIPEVLDAFIQIQQSLEMLAQQLGCNLARHRTPEGSASGVSERAAKELLSGENHATLPSSHCPFLDGSIFPATRVLPSLGGFTLSSWADSCALEFFEGFLVEHRRGSATQ